MTAAVELDTFLTHLNRPGATRAPGPTSPPPTGPGTGSRPGPQVWPATAITVTDLGCGHIGGEQCDTSCDYWRGVALGEYPHPDAYQVDGDVVTLRPHLPGLAPLTDPALREVA